MAKIVRNHPTLLGLVGALALSAVLLWWASGGSAPAQAMMAAAALYSPPTPLDPALAGEIDALRRDVGLTDDALNVLNLEDPAALLSDMKDWYTNNRDALAARRQTIDDLRAQIRLRQSAINLGDDQSATLATVRTELAHAEAGLQIHLDGMRDRLFSGLSVEQRGTITRMITQHDLPMPYRALPLTVEQSNALLRAMHQQEQRQSITRSDERSAEVLMQFEQEREQAVGAANLQRLATIQAYLGRSSERVVEALNQVLPAPTEE